LALLLAAVLVSRVVAAASVAGVSLDEAIAGSELIFEGRVTGLETRTGASAAQIVTFVRFQVLDVIKGRSPGASVELGFLGGTAGGLTLWVPDMHLPQVGEHGIYFVESLSRLQVHPMYGWDQGQLRVKPDPADGSPRLYTHDGRAVTGFAPAQRGQETAASGLSQGYPRGLAVQPDAPVAAMAVADFKQQLRNRVGGR
jgi:hypothetical protein